MAGRQLGFEFAQQRPPSVASVELAAQRARQASGPRVRAQPHHARASLHADSRSDTTRPHQLDAEPSDAPDQTGSPAPAAPPPQPRAETARPGEPGSHERAPLPQHARDQLALALELSLRACSTGPLRLTLTDNRRTMVSLRRDKKTEAVEVRLHHMFLLADADVWSALGEYLFRANRSAAACIGSYIERHREHIRHPARRPLALSPAGRHHDLSDICRAINARYFDGKACVSITWSREHTSRARHRRRSIKLGSYTSRDRLIRVHPALDAAFVPRYFVEYIVYHEMLHHVLPPKLRKGRRQLHGPAFVARERLFADYDAALRWERDNLDALLGRRGNRNTSQER